MHWNESKRLVEQKQQEEEEENEKKKDSTVKAKYREAKEETPSEKLQQETKCQKQNISARDVRER